MEAPAGGQGAPAHSDYDEALSWASQETSA